MDVGDNEYTESVGTNDTGGSKRKRVRHRKKKQSTNENIENQMNASNVETPAVGILKSEAKRRSDNSLKCNTHVR